MAEYLGKITLVNVADGTPGTPGAAGSGIQSSMVYYAISKTNSAPPALTEATLKSESGIISFSDISSTFQIKEGVLYGVQNGILIPLSINNENNGNILIGLEGGWDTTVPAAPSGWYVWTKTVFTYTDGNQTITYTVAQNGQDGQDAETYRIETSQEEILKFVMENGSISITPGILNISIVDKSSNPVENLNIDNLSFQIYNQDEGSWTNFYFPLQLTETEKEIEVTLNSPLEINKDEIVKIYDLTTINSEAILKISYQFEEYSLIKYINVRYGITKDQATFSLHAGGITASIQSSGLNFDANGLTVTGGGLQVFDKTGQKKLLGFDTNGDLSISGSGYFKGEIHATNGSFTGTINATDGSFAGKIEAGEGSIGGFTINDNALSAVNNSIVLYSGNGEEEGSIYAKNLTLGEGAKIQTQMQLGDRVVLSNPDIEENLNSYLKVIDNEERSLINFTSDGKITIGNNDNAIIMNGADGTIQSYNYDSGTGWFISNKESIFNNITVKGSIRASVLEYGEVQAVGGILMVRPGSRIISASWEGESAKLVLEDTFGFAVNDRCLITPDRIGEIAKIWGTIEAMEIENIGSEEAGESLSDLTQKKWILLRIDSDSIQVELNRLIGLPIVSFGYINPTTKEGVNNIGIGINGSTSSAMIPAQSLSVFELNDKDDLTPRIVLGKLPNDKEAYGSIAGTYGLYAENVLLKGALITQTSSADPVYSGISTQFAKDAPKSVELDGKGFENFVASEILFWAGAEDDSREGIQRAPFFIDKNGNFYSRSGYFEGSIITKSVIEAAEIRTATLTGTSSSGFALTIQDVNQGIVFRKNTEDVFKLTGDGVSLKTKLQIVQGEAEEYCFQADEQGRAVLTNGFVHDQEGTLQISSSSISLLKTFSKEEKTGEKGASIEFQENTISLYANGTGTMANFIVGQSQNEIYNNLYLSSSSTVKYGEKMSCQPAQKDSKIIGYDLYIFD